MNNQNIYDTDVADLLREMLTDELISLQEIKIELDLMMN